MTPTEALSGLADRALQSLQGVGDPRLLAGALLLVLAALLGWYGLRRVRRTPGARLRRVLADRDTVDLLLHPNPDPDAMAAAMGLSRIAETVDTETRIRYPGEIRHQENRAFRTVLGLEAESVESAADLAADVVLVDHNRPRSLQSAGDLDPLGVVDHHPGDGAGRAFTDIRPEYGASATIVVEYLQDLGIDCTAAGDPPALTEAEATGLLYGILSDTNHLTRGPTAAEFSAAAALYPGADEGLLDRIANPEVDAEVLDVTARAIENREVRAPFAVSSVGECSNVDAIPQAAEELLKLEGTTAVVIMGENDGTLHLSGRSRDDRVHMGSVLESVVEDVPMAGAGGHARMGGGQLSIEHLEGLGPSDGVTMSELTDRLFAAMAGER